MNETRQSLLLRAQTGQTEAWKDLTGLYHPLILARHSGQRGAFHSWLRAIVCSRTADYWRALDAATQAQGGSGAAALQEIAEPDSALNRHWDEEHDRYVLHWLLDLVDEEFEPVTLRAFRRLALDGVSGAEAAGELGLSVAAVYVAKSRVLARIRQEAEGLIN
jgi:RNA polymerase sigma-70 factor (ECF subfamily)